jgi:hypothetical protein
VQLHHGGRTITAPCYRIVEDSEYPTHRSEVGVLSRTPASINHHLEFGSVVFTFSF